jgi:hypothetical protein
VAGAEGVGVVGAEDRQYGGQQLGEGLGGTGGVTGLTAPGGELVAGGEVEVWSGPRTRSR